MRTETENRPRSFPTQVTITADPEGASVVLDCKVIHRAEVPPGEEPIVDARAGSGETHPAVDRAITWARDNGYDVAVVIW
jgi:hypothetical protein